MSLVRGNNYSSAGIGTTEKDKFEINRSVFILDATAGRGYDAYDDSAYPAEGQVQRKSFGVSVKQAAIVFGVMMVLLIAVIAVKHVHIRKLAYEVSLMENQVKALSEYNAELDKKLMDAREITRISLYASQMGMVLVEEQEVHRVTAPDTRPFAVRGEVRNENTQ